MRRAVGADTDDDERDTAWRQGAEAYRRGADLARDTVLKKYALHKLETVYDEKHLDQPRDAEPVLRGLIAISPGDLAPVFRLARAEERQEQFDAAESTLLAAHQLKPDDIEPTASWRSSSRGAPPNCRPRRSGRNVSHRRRSTAAPCPCDSCTS